MLESRHVIGLFMLMLVFSGVFFALGYVMGRNQYDGQVRAASNPRATPDPFVPPKQVVSPKHSRNSPPPTSPTPAPDAASDEFATEFRLGFLQRRQSRARRQAEAGARYNDTVHRSCNRHKQNSTHAANVSSKSCERLAATPAGSTPCRLPRCGKKPTPGRRDQPAQEKISRIRGLADIRQVLPRASRPVLRFRNPRKPRRKASRTPVSRPS